jgi:hypothetical protein
MALKTIVLTCAPILNEAQTQGFMQMIHDFEKRQCRIVYYGNVYNTAFKSYAHQKLSYPKLFYKFPFYWVLLQIDRDKWISRLKSHHPPGDNVVISFKVLKSIIRAAVKYFCSVKPAMFVCWNPHSPTFGIWADTAQLMGIPVAAVEWGLLPGTFILDKDGTLAASRIFNRPVLYNSPKHFFTIGEQVYHDLQKQSISLYPQATEALPDSFTHTNDSQVRILLIGIDMVDSGSLPEDHQDHLGLLPFHRSCIHQALDIAAADANFKVIYKPHPSHNFDKQSGELASNCWMSNSNPDQLIKWADVIVCSGSKMEFSALLAGKPLVNVGAGILYKKGCSYEVDEPAQLKHTIMQARQHGVRHEQIQAFKQFLGFLLDDYLYVYGDVKDNMVIIDRIVQHCK